MFQFDAWWMPDGETHMTDLMAKTNVRVDGRLTYQYPKYERSVSQCVQGRVAVDVGAHVGLWSYWMAQRFERLYAFEPCDRHRECWALNVTQPSAELYPYALGASACAVGLCVEVESSGNTRIAAGDTVEMRTLDSFDLQSVDFIKVDCEGYEAFVLEGAQQTLERCRPVVIVEQKHGTPKRYGRHGRAALTFLASLGATELWDWGGDFCFAFPEVH
jgi:FkbM family methyltransferase